jgi:hypothetical protein
MQTKQQVFRPRQPSTWTAERVSKLNKAEMQQLRENAGTLGESAVVALCDEALKALPKGAAGKLAAKQVDGRRLISRAKAFEARGVHLEDRRTSWGGVRKSDGTVVLGLWADAVHLRDGACSYLLWCPNTDGKHPWYETPAGMERLGHCKMVGDRNAEGLLVQGQALAGHLPEDKARSVHGVDPETVISFKVEKHGEEYWAVWGKRPDSPAP